MESETLRYRIEDILETRYCSCGGTLEDFYADKVSVQQSGFIKTNPVKAFRCNNCGEVVFMSKNSDQIELLDEAFGDG